MGEAGGGVAENIGEAPSGAAVTAATTTRPVTAADLAGATERAVVRGHDGRSGARLERVVLGDGRRLVVKRTSPDRDVVMQVTGTRVSREYRLWRSGVLDRLPAGVGHALVGAWVEGGESVLVMRDLGDRVGSWSRRVTRPECRRLLSAATSMHRSFAGLTVEHLVPLAARVSVFAPSRMDSLPDTVSPLPALVRRGWELFADLVDPDVVAAVHRVFEEPDRLAGPLSDRPVTLVHADLWLVNVAFEEDRMLFLDWDLATSAPGALDLALFLTGSASQVDATKDEIVDDFRALQGDDLDEVALRLALFAGLVDLGWNKALDVVENPDPAVRAREEADLRWWVERGREAIEGGLVGT